MRAQCHETHVSTVLQHITPSEYRQVDCHCWSILYSGTDSLIVISLKDTPLLCWPRPLSICLQYIEDETVNSGSVVDAVQDICNQRYRHTPVILTGQGRVTLVTKWQNPQWYQSSRMNSGCAERPDHHKLSSQRVTPTTVGPINLL